MDLGMFAKANRMSGDALKIFLARYQARPLTHHHSLFEDFRLELGIRAQKSPWECFWWRTRKILRASPDILFAFVEIPRSISISQSKQGGHTMSHSFFMPANVSLG